MCAKAWFCRAALDFGLVLLSAAACCLPPFHVQATHMEERRAFNRRFASWEALSASLQSFGCVEP